LTDANTFLVGFRVPFLFKKSQQVDTIYNSVANHDQVLNVDF